MLRPAIVKVQSSRDHGIPITVEHFPTIFRNPKLKSLATYYDFNFETSLAIFAQRAKGVYSTVEPAK